ncbi:MAG TPA: DUF2887 domain-containing protein [Geminocystis sp. M7585_C2015_104]|nr:DUF2887 domain-containing protein [Geminocystis sp. M7585_C2015_104]
MGQIYFYLKQQKPVQDWVAVAIFPSRAVDVKNLAPFP